jgi:hypothetical protein
MDYAKVHKHIQNPQEEGLSVSYLNTWGERSKSKHDLCTIASQPAAASPRVAAVGSASVKKCGCAFAQGKREKTNHSHKPDKVKPETYS